MIYVATERREGTIKAYFSKNKKALKEMGFNWIAHFESETKAVIWVNENYLNNIKEFLYG
ncbi:MAG: hypothetical protein HC880_21880 [Bacteroidia bacterium]|nr:hypothetical protein [Bacteroidia bacterium]